MVPCWCFLALPAAGLDPCGPPAPMQPPAAEPATLAATPQVGSGSLRARVGSMLACGSPGRLQSPRARCSFAPLPISLAAVHYKAELLPRPPLLHAARLRRRPRVRPGEASWEAACGCESVENHQGQTLLALFQCLVGIKGQAEHSQSRLPPLQPPAAKPALSSPAQPPSSLSQASSAPKPFSTCHTLLSPLCSKPAVASHA